MSDVIWKPVKGYEDKYRVSSDGVVYSIGRTSRNGRPIGDRVLKGGIYPNKYKYVILRDDHLHDERVMIHRLVAQSFIPNPANKPVVNHINGDRQDNRVDNLEWCTTLENVQHAIRTGLVGKVCKIERPVKITTPNDDVLHFDTMVDVCKYFGFTKCWLGNYSKKHGNPCSFKGYNISISERRCKP